MSAFLAGSAPSCTREVIRDERPDGNHRGIPVSLSIDDLKTSGTKSVLNDPDIETKVTSVTLAAYSSSDGALIASEYYSDANGMRLDLGEHTQARICALVNMGDLRASLPANASGLSTMSYDIPSYTGSPESVNEAGIPMAGWLDYDTSASAGTDVSVKRLMAKLVVDLKIHWDGSISSVRIRNMNRHLTPFGESRARTEADTFDEELEAGGGVRQGTFVFYIPENEQGTVPSITASSDKSGDNSSLSAIKERLTYLEVTVSGENKYDGEITYRSYLGKNDSSDFSISGNCRYTWKVDYLPDGTVLDDWKHENALSWSDFRYQVFAPEIAGYTGDNLYVYLREAEDKYEKGKLKTKGSFRDIDTRLADWTHEAWEPSNFLTFKEIGETSGAFFRRYVAKQEGSGYVQANIELESGIFTDKVLLSCHGPEPILALGVQPTAIKLGETLQFSLTLNGNDLMGEIFTYYFLRKGRFGVSEYGGFDITADYHYHIIGKDGKWTPTETGTYEMYAVCSAAWVIRPVSSNTVSFTVTEADKTSYTLTIEPGNPTPKLVGESIGLRAYLNTFVNGMRSGHEDITEAVSWKCEDAEVSTDAGQIVSTKEGTFSIRAEYEAPDGEELSASVNVSFTGDPNYITLSAKPTSISVGETSTASVLFNGSGPVTASSTISAYTSETGSATSDIVRISGSTITGSRAGTCYLEAMYVTGGKTYQSSRVKLIVTDAAPADPVTVIWESEPTYVAQRGKLSIGGLQSGETVMGVTATSGSNVVRIAQSGPSYYVGLLKAGSYTLTVTTSKGRTKTLSGTAAAPVMTLSQTTLYANPDGTVAHTGTDGLTGGTQGVSYKTTGGIAFSVESAETATGTKLQRGLYDELLDPTPSTTAGILGLDGMDVYANDVYEYTGTNGLSATELGTVTVSPKASSAGVASKSYTVKRVNPFVLWASTVISKPDEEDYGLINQYQTYKFHNYTQKTVELPKILASDGRCGIEVLRNGSAVSGIFAAAFNTAYIASDSMWNTSYTLSDAILTEHIGGFVELKGYVKNRHSGSCLRRAGARFGLYVNGAIGAKMTGIGTSTVVISTAFCGDEADYGFDLLANGVYLNSVKLIGTSYSENQIFSYIPNTRVNNILVDGSALNARVYQLHRDGAPLDSAAQIMEAEKPRFEFRSVASIGTFVQNSDLPNAGYYLLQPYGTPTVRDGYGEHGFYKLWLLESIDERPDPGPKAGWIID